MSKINTSVILDKMGEVCDVLLSQESYHELREMIDQFASDEDAIEQYESFMDMHRSLQQREHRNEELTQEELNEYEQAERELYENDLIRRFLYAQREFSNLQHLVGQFLIKSIELDRLPTLDELKNGGCGCGGNCGCGGGH